MTFNQREKILIAAALAVLAVLALDRYAVTPLLAWRYAAQAQRELRQAEMAEATSLLQRRKLLDRRWKDMRTDGLKPGRAEAEGQILRSLRDWADEAGVRISSLRLEYPPQQSELPEIVVHAAGTGSMRSARQLLWRIEDARIPVRIKMLQLGSRKDGTDDLSVLMRVSTLYLPGPETPAPTGWVTGRAAGRRQLTRGDL